MSHSDTPVYKRVLLKLSGEALSAGADGILNHEYLDEIVGVIKRCMDKGVQFGIVVGAGNIWRGRQGGTMEHTRADHMGMLATVINSLAIQDAFERADIDARVMTAVPIEAFAEFYSRNKAVSHLNRGKVTIFGCGMGNPFFSTDTAAGSARCGDRCGRGTYGEEYRCNLYRRSAQKSRCEKAVRG